MRVIVKVRDKNDWDTNQDEKNEEYEFNSWQDKSVFLELTSPILTYERKKKKEKERIFKGMVIRKMDGNEGRD
jgi:hypothetical protein